MDTCIWLHQNYLKYLKHDTTTGVGFFPDKNTDKQKKTTRPNLRVECDS